MKYTERGGRRETHVARGGTTNVDGGPADPTEEIDDSEGFLRLLWLSRWALALTGEGEAQPKGGARPGVLPRGLAQVEGVSTRY